ncbi:hypothetical protein RIB2604_03701500 [Aspergillus luchuensis]|uniref:Secreted protein n=1 Tax=Aspergillus kawachii TaxID=1069201 RepID=A0A146G250_ASPKA|nr:hypothetical protein RIB2604_03701500 [Aspergillus luchuensis]
MKILKISLTLFLAITAAPSPYTQEYKYAQVTVQQQKITSEKQILVKDSSTGDILGSACSNALNTGAFSDFGIVADVGPNGDGNITAGPSTYVVHEDPQYSGGITCYRMYNDYESFVENLDCGSADHCTVGASQSKSYTIGWTATADASQWISGGFAVQASWTTGLDYQCTASSHQTVCIWYNTAHTAYTVQNGLYNVCTGFNPNNGAGFVMFSPNQNNKGAVDYGNTL